MSEKIFHNNIFTVNRLRLDGVQFIIIYTLPYMSQVPPPQP